MKFARGWLRFHGKLALPPNAPFHEQLEMFSNALRFNQGLTATTVRGYSNRAQAFLTWLAAQGGNLETVSVADIDNFLTAKRVEGWMSRGIASQCKAMRSFFRFAEMRGWCIPDLALAIRGPRISKDELRPMGPTWTQVRQLLRLAEGSEPELRGKTTIGNAGRSCCHHFI